MNGLEKIKVAEKFDTLSDTQKQILYNKYGEDMVKEEMRRCKIVDEIINLSADELEKTVSTAELLDLFTNKKFDKYNEILKDIEDM